MTVFNASNNAVANNTILGNQGNGVAIGGSSATGNQVLGNYIGTDAAGAMVLGNNSNGVAIAGGSFNNTIGGTAAGAANTITNNGGDGVFISDAGTISNAIRANAIYTNANLGINLSGGSENGFGVTANDGPGDSDSGPNNLQNFPVITGTISSGGGIIITGSLTSTVNTTFQVDFFANSVCVSAGNREGENYLGTANVATDASGVSPFSVSFPVAVPSGYFITATATDPDGNTSEFSACQTVP